jgi:hypothetical protein
MKKTHVTIVLSLLLIVAALLWQRFVDSGTVEGFQTLPTGSQTVTDFVIYSDMATIMEKLPFLHTNFNELNMYETAGLTSPLTMMPTSTPTSTINLRNLITSDTTPSLISFKLKSSITGPIDQTAVDALNSASTSLLGSAGKIAFKTSNGNLYPSIVLSSGASSTVANGGSSATTPPADGYYTTDAPTTFSKLYVKTVSGTTTLFFIPNAINTSACGKIIPTTVTNLLPAATFATLTNTQVATCTDLPASPANGYYKSSDTTDTAVYFVASNSSGMIGKWNVNDTTTPTCPGKTYPTYATVSSTLPADTLTSIPLWGNDLNICSVIP